MAASLPSITFLRATLLEELRRYGQAKAQVVGSNQCVRVNEHGMLNASEALAAGAEIICQEANGIWFLTHCAVPVPPSTRPPEPPAKVETWRDRPPML